MAKVVLLHWKRVEAISKIRKSCRQAKDQIKESRSGDSSSDERLILIANRNGVALY